MLQLLAVANHDEIYFQEPSKDLDLETDEVKVQMKTRGEEGSSSGIPRAANFDKGKKTKRIHRRSTTS